VHEIKIDLYQVFSSAPIIYSILCFLSISAVMLWLYAFLISRTSVLMPKSRPSLFSKMLQVGIEHRHLGYQTMLEIMKAEGKRHAAPFWQKVALLNDIAIIAPMIGLLGTVTGMFYAFYDLNRSMETIGALFDGLGISVGTTVAGLIVSIFAMIFYTLLKYRLIRQMHRVETEVFSHARRIFDEPHTR
jgi:biopolymer transport protein ExbB/TolQ